jgi:peptidoglycan/xylan/chitin deacetylase (PgdA/CDA1 family)
MVRGLIKNAVAVALNGTRAEKLAALAGRSSRHPLVVGYHQVVSEFRPDSRCGITAMQTSCKMLENHLDWIGSRYEFVSLDEIGAHYEAGKPFTKPVAAVTFDDGYRDVYLNAFPILKRKGVPAAVFVVTDLVGTETPPLHDRLYSALVMAFDGWVHPSQMLSERLARLNIAHSTARKVRLANPNIFATMRALIDSLNHSEIEALTCSLEADFTDDPSPSLDEARPLTWEMVREMSEAGLTIGSHTKSHALLTAEESDRVLEEVLHSRATLQSRLGAAPRHFAYPDGRFNARIAKLVSSGYQFAYTTCRHQLSSYPLMTIPRKMLWENSCTNSSGRFSPAVMNCQVHGVFDWISGCGESHGATAHGGRTPVSATEEAARPSWHGGWFA